jgi:signal transduction histidine kinase
LLADPKLDRSPIETGLTAAMAALNASRGVFLWTEDGREPQSAVFENGEMTLATRDPPTRLDVAPGAFLYDIAKDRALMRDPERNLLGRRPNALIGEDIVAACKLDQGLAIPVRSGTGEGQLFLEDTPSLSTDHIDLGDQLSLDLAAHLQRHALLNAAGESAEARSRLALARDLHDSVVQFLAGAAFRLEAMKRSEASGRTLEPELNELKKLMLQEQGELRAFITALRGGSTVALTDLVRDLQALTERLSRQWAIDCTFKSEGGELMVSTNVHLDAHQLVREAVANAVRHAGAKSVQIVLTADRRTVRLDLINDGAAYPGHGDQVELPQSLRERVEHAGGIIELSRGMDVTKLSIALPAAGPTR